VRFGAPIAVAGDSENMEDVEQLTTAVMLAIAELLPPERRGVYAEVEVVES
jgi:hypothetical protein